MSLKPEDIMRVKGLGFLRNRGTECFSGRVVAPGTVFTAKNFADLAEIAEKYGNGRLICTSRQAVEVPGIPYDKIDEVIAVAAERGLRFGGTGNKIRPVTACKGTTCVFGNCDTHAIATKIHNEFYLGWNKVTLPHKFKIGVGGCPNSCMKPSLNDIGIEGRKAVEYDLDACRGCKSCAVEKACPMKAAKLIDGRLSVNAEICNSCGVCVGKCPFGAVKNEAKTVYQIYVGGTWGKHSRMGTPLSRLVAEDEVMPLIEKTILWFRENAYAKERLGAAIDRVGVEAFEAAVFSDDLISRRDEILSKEIMTR